MYFAVLKKRKVIICISIVLSIIALSITLKTTGAYSVFYGGNLRKLPIYRVQTEEKKLAISFDCAWGVDYTDKLLSVMEQEDVYCTFFMVEFWAKKYPEYVKKIADAGHEIGTHSATHPYMSKLSKSAVQKELTTSIQVIESVTGKKVEVFRPPYGDYNDLLIDTAKEMGLYTIQWDVDSLDWKDLSATEIINRVNSRVKNGSIVLFHNQGLHTAEALPLLIKKLKNQGYTFTRIGDLIYRDNYRMAVDGTQISNS
jgi:polysaccharide deacetylase family sporulation protein PdaB